LRVGWVKFQPHTFALDHLPGKGGCFLAEPFHGLLWVLGLGRIDADEPDTLAALEKKSIAVNDPLHNFEVAIGYGLI
jgi:hypothetical protein